MDFDYALDRLEKMASAVHHTLEKTDTIYGFHDHALPIWTTGSGRGTLLSGRRAPLAVEWVI
jgi:hypothetical protein